MAGDDVFVGLTHKLVWVISIDQLASFAGPYGNFVTNEGAWQVHFIDAQDGRWVGGAAQGGDYSEEFYELERTGKLPPFQPTTDIRLYDPPATPAPDSDR